MRLNPTSSGGSLAINAPASYLPERDGEALPATAPSTRHLLNAALETPAACRQLSQFFTYDLRQPRIGALPKGELIRTLIERVGTGQLVVSRPPMVDNIGPLVARDEAAKAQEPVKEEGFDLDCRVQLQEPLVLATGCELTEPTPDPPAPT